MSERYTAEPEGFFNQGKSLYRLLSNGRQMAGGMSGHDAQTTAAALNAAEQRDAERKLLEELIEIAKQAKSAIETGCTTYGAMPADAGDITNAIDCAIDEYAALQTEEKVNVRPTTKDA